MVPGAVVPSPSAERHAAASVTEILFVPSWAMPILRTFSAPLAFADTSLSPTFPLASILGTISPRVTPVESTNLTAPVPSVSAEGLVPLVRFHE